MDGRQANETCRDDVTSMAPPKPGEGIPDGAVAKDDPPAAETATSDEKTVPAFGLVALVIGVGAAMMLALRRR